MHLNEVQVKFVSKSRRPTRRAFPEGKNVLKKKRCTYFNHWRPPTDFQGQHFFCPQNMQILVTRDSQMTFWAKQICCIFFCSLFPKSMQIWVMGDPQMTFWGKTIFLLHFFAICFPPNMQTLVIGDPQIVKPQMTIWG